MLGKLAPTKLCPALGLMLINYSSDGHHMLVLTGKASLRVARLEVVSVQSCSKILRFVPL